MEAIGKYWGDLRIAAGEAGFLTWILVAGWLVFPVAVQTVFYPSDAIGFGYWLQHQPVPRFYTMDTVATGEIKALAALAGLILVMLVVTALFYYRAGFWVKLWPVPGLLVGVFVNAAWWIDKGFFDRPGALAGLSVLALTVFCESICERFGADLVFGKGNRPRLA